MYARPNVDMVLMVCVSFDSTRSPLAQLHQVLLILSDPSSIQYVMRCVLYPSLKFAMTAGLASSSSGSCPKMRLFKDVKSINGISRAAFASSIAFATLDPGLARLPFKRDSAVCFGPQSSAVCCSLIPTE